jgi:O-antigen/teichoic acid export membrane protein
MPWGYALVTGVLIPLTAVAQVEGEAVRATRRVALAYVPQFIVRPILTVGAGLLLFRYGRDSTFATASAVVAALGVAVWQYASVRQAYGPKVFSAAPVAENAEWVRTGIPLMVSSVVTYIVNQADILIVGGLLGFRDAGYYAAAQRTATVVGFILFASNAVVAPALSRMFAAGDIQGMRRMVTQVTRWTFVAAVLSGVVVAGIAPFLLDWFGEGFQQAAGVLILLVGARIVSAAAGPVGYILGLTGHERIAARLQTIIGLGGVAAMAILAMRYGLMGAAIGSALSLAGVNVALAVVVWRHYRIAPLGMGARPPREA